MISFIIRRIVMMFFTLVGISIVSFIIIQAPPGDYLSTYMSRLSAAGIAIDPAEIEALKERYGLGKPMYLQYIRWVINLLHGDLGRSMQWDASVKSIILQRLPGSFTLSLFSFIFSYLIAIPIGVFSATHQYSFWDYVFSFIGFLGRSIPPFFLALIALWLYFTSTGNVAVGLFSKEFQTASWSFTKFIDLLSHIWLPVLIIGLEGTCGIIRVVRNNLLDELQKPYVITARSKGLPERRLLYKYPFRIAINPVISTVGWMLPSLVSGELFVSLILNIPTLGPVFIDSLRSQDMFLASSIILILSSLTVIGTLISDILLVWVDPRIKYL